MRMSIFNPRSLPRLQPSSIDERIRKACQYPKTNAVLRYLPRGGGVKPLHPAYVCWYNSCEDCDDWWIEAACSLDTVDFQENIGSLLFDERATLDIPSVEAECEYVGFWLKIPSIPGTRTIQVGLWTSLGYAKIEFVRTSPAITFQNIFATDSDFWSGSKLDYSAHIGYWRWFEIYTHYDSASGYSDFSIRRNGVAKGGSASLLGDVGTPQIFKKWDTYYRTSMKFDYVRVADRYEYPPA